MINYNMKIINNLIIIESWARYNIPMNESNQAYIARKIKQHRLDKHMTQSEIAKLVGITENYFARLERGERSLTVDTLYKISKGLGVSSQDLLPF